MNYQWVDEEFSGGTLCFFLLLKAERREKEYCYLSLGHGIVPELPIA
jgi:hypothetical protein